VSTAADILPAELDKLRMMRVDRDQRAGTISVSGLASLSASPATSWTIGAGVSGGRDLMMRFSKATLS
jgi:hypothetical protein